MLADYMTVQGMMAQQQSSSHQHDFLGGLTMLATVDEAGLEPAGGILCEEVLRKEGSVLRTKRQRGSVRVVCDRGERTLRLGAFLRTKANVRGNIVQVESAGQYNMRCQLLETGSFTLGQERRQPLAIGYL